MFSSTQFKTSDGKRKSKGKKKPRMIQQSNQRKKSLLKKLGYQP